MSVGSVRGGEGRVLGDWDGCSAGCRAHGGSEDERGFGAVRDQVQEVSEDGC